MNAHSSKSRDNKDHSVANEISRRQEDHLSTSQFVDNQSRSSVLQQLKNIANAPSGESASNVEQLATSIKHTSSDVTWFGARGEVGKEMVAELDPSNQVVGSATDPNLKTPLDFLVAKHNKGLWARGHLLNHDLGGFGVPKNLFPISARANAHHAQAIEYPVKKALTQADTNQQLNPNGDKVNVKYSVLVKGTPSRSQFHCVWKYADKGFNNFVGGNSAIIESNLNDPTRSDQKETYFSARGSTRVLRNWQHRRRKGELDEFNDEDRIEKVKDNRLIPAINFGDVASNLNLDDDQLYQIAQETKVEKLNRALRRDLERIPSEAKERAEKIVARRKNKKDKKRKRSIRLTIKSFTESNQREVSIEATRIKKVLIKKRKRQHVVDLGRIDEASD